MEKIEPILPSEEDDRGRTASNARWFLVAVPWIGRVDSQWRDIPAHFGRRYAVCMRLTLAPQGRLAPGRAHSRGRNRNRGYPDRFDRRESALAFGLGINTVSARRDRAVD